MAEHGSRLREVAIWPALPRSGTGLQGTSGRRLIAATRVACAEQVCERAHVRTARLFDLVRMLPRAQTPSLDSKQTEPGATGLSHCGDNDPYQHYITVLSVCQEEVKAVPGSAQQVVQLSSISTLPC